MEPGTVPVRQLVLGPALLTLGITLLRLVGELLDWSPRLFSREAGGGAALVGIVWLIPLLGMYFALKLEQMGHAPARAWKVLGLSAAAIVLFPAVGLAINNLQWPVALQLATFVVVSVPMALLAWQAWPALGRVLLAYALCARVPVALVMLVAMLGEWGTHYDASAPEFPPMSVGLKFVTIGLLPQLTIWIGITMSVGALFGGLALAVAHMRQGPGETAPQT
jgi:hypothetical protein